MVRFWQRCFLCFRKTQGVDGERFVVSFSCVECFSLREKVARVGIWPHSESGGARLFASQALTVWKREGTFGSFPEKNNYEQEETEQWIKKL
jgi:hypothetical protein